MSASINIVATSKGFLLLVGVYVSPSGTLAAVKMVLFEIVGNGSERLLGSSALQLQLQVTANQTAREAGDGIEGVQW